MQILVYILFTNFLTYHMKLELTLGMLFDKGSWSMTFTT